MDDKPTSPKNERIGWMRGRKLYLERSVAEPTQPATQTPGLDASALEEKQDKREQQLNKRGELQPRRGRLHLRRHPLVEMVQPRLYKPTMGETLDNGNKNMQKNQETAEKPSTSKGAVDNKDDAQKTN